MEQQLIELQEMQNKMKSMITAHEKNMIKLGYEVWRTIDGLDNYQVSSFGRVKKTDRILKASSDANGYKKINLYENGNKKQMYVHRLVCRTFIDNPYNKTFVDHIDNNPSNNNVKNLRFATNGENQMNRTINKMVVKE